MKLILDLLFYGLKYIPLIITVSLIIIYVSRKFDSFDNSAEFSSIHLIIPLLVSISIYKGYYRRYEDPYVWLFVLISVILAGFISGYIILKINYQTLSLEDKRIKNKFVHIFSEYDDSFFCNFLNINRGQYRVFDMNKCNYRLFIDIYFENYENFSLLSFPNTTVVSYVLFDGVSIKNCDFNSILKLLNEPNSLYPVVLKVNKKAVSSFSSFELATFEIVGFSYDQKHIKYIFEEKYQLMQVFYRNMEMKQLTNEIMKSDKKTFHKLQANMYFVQDILACLRKNIDLAVVNSDETIAKFNELFKKEYTIDDIRTIDVGICEEYTGVEVIINFFSKLPKHDDLDKTISEGIEFSYFYQVMYDAVMTYLFNEEHNIREEYDLYMKNHRIISEIREDLSNKMKTTRVEINKYDNYGSGAKNN